MPTIADNLRKAAEILHNSGIPEPRKEAASLMAFTLGKDKTFLIAHSDYRLSESEDTQFRKYINRRALREPFQYIIGRQEFYGLDFTVAPGVLIPRPETEIIVENAVEILRDSNDQTFCEIGTGSGCIAVSILHEIQTSAAAALDISADALEIARKNAEKHNVENRLTLKQSDVFTALTDEKFGLIVSNPPYIPSNDIPGLQPEVRDFEPTVALTDGKNGLSIIEKIIIQSPEFLKPQGILLTEIGFNQSTAAENMFSSEIWQSVETLCDLRGIPRTLKAVLK